ncbi:MULTISPECIES: DUF3383 domain-containing protein [unclassified Gilliamella]|uniref:DUF3383 domain-containing protein n=1 Tax=unclassified Gilliamella TaxID=2685620 RepID=UPI00132800D9|nr:MULTISPECIES: DUF3383 domain-containing protein [unclassified Gilliamella]MWN31015.1 DUF3383 family protein [Gilliamella sp. Pra-s60]MWP28420.1 DUF3383 family protein [Gilliamella sp. Pra-s54]
MSLPISQVVDVTLPQSPRGAQKRDLSVVAIFTDEMCDEFTNPDTRYVVVSDVNSVASLFGTNSDAYRAAAALFSARPKPKTALIARYMKENFTSSAISSKINGSALAVSYIQFKNITDGYLSFYFNDVKIDVKELDFSTVSSMHDVANVVNAKLNDLGVKFIYDAVGSRFILSANTDGKGANFGYVFDAQLDGTYIGSMTNLIDGRSTLINGEDAITYNKETPAEALSKLQNQYQNWYGVYFANTITDAELVEAHDWVVAQGVENAKVMAYTETRPANIEYTDTNVLKTLSKRNSGRLMVQYNNKGNTHAAAELMGIALTTVWTGVNTAKTVKFKQEVSVTSDDKITINEATKCRRLGINFYTDYAGVNMLAEGVMLGGTFIDETVGLDAFINVSQVQMFNTLQGNPFKISQTDRGQEILLSAMKIPGEQFINNGFLGSGKWTGGDVGELSYGDHINGYYFYSDSFDMQDTADREARKMMPINCALKLAGAGHSVDIIVQFNR